MRGRDWAQAQLLQRSDLDELFPNSHGTLYPQDAILLPE